jgi:MYXO-CTERM domain-containing protein
MTSDGLNYHSEIIKNTAQLADTDLYYGHAIYLPADWQFHGQNVTFQQWAPENPAGPWILMFVEGEKLRVGGAGISVVDLAPISNLRGTWIRVVTRIKMATAGNFEVWVNGNKVLSRSGDFRARGPSIRWSNGIYCTRWDTEAPAGQRMLSIFHDNLRIATTYDEAEPASWGGNDSTPAPDAGTDAEGAPGDDGGMADTRPVERDAGGSTGGSGGGSPGTGGNSGTGGMTATGGRSGTGGSPATGGAGEPEPEDPAPPRNKASGGCNVGGPAAGGPLWLLALAAVLARRRARQGRWDHCPVISTEQ